MKKFASFAAIITLSLLCSCAGPRVGKEFANRQVSFIEVQSGPKVNPMRLAYIKDSLQQTILSKLQGRGNPPAVGLTVRVYDIEFPNEQIFGEALLGPTRQSAYILAQGELWDPTTRAQLTKFDISVSVPVRRANSFASVLGYPSGTEPDTFDQINSKLSKALAENIAGSIYGYEKK